jgi:hypothetical protein
VDEAVDPAGRVFGAAPLVVVESLGVVVEVLFGPTGFEMALVGPAEAVPAVVAGSRKPEARAWEQYTLKAPTISRIIIGDVGVLITSLQRSLQT